MARILVVDDDRDTVLSTIQSLEDVGYEVRGEVGWRGVPRALHEWLPDCIVLDLLMPEVSGRELLDMLHCHPNELIRKIPVIVITGVSEKRAKHWSLTHGAAEFLAKPVGLETLLEAIARAVRG